MPTWLILNPNAGTAEEISQLEVALERFEDLSVHRTAQAGDGERLARLAIENGATRIVAAGGDGTLNEIVNGIAPDFGRVALGILPLGTGNDFTRTLLRGQQMEKLAIAEQLAHLPETPADVVRISFGGRERYFLNAANIGFAATLARDMNNELKRWIGTLAYPVMALSQMGTLEPFHLRVTVDSRELDVDALNVVVGNGQYLGGGVQALPQASPTDGLLDVLVVPDLPLTDLLMLAPTLLRGEHATDTSLKVLRGIRVRLESIPPIPVNVDGEYLGEFATLEFEVLPGVLGLVIPVAPEPVANASK